MNYENLWDFLDKDFNVFYHDRSYDFKLFFAFLIMCVKGMEFHNWKIYPIINNYSKELYTLIV